MAAAMGIASDRLYNIEDGVAAWIERGFPTEYGQGG
jgi:rhodanese-related sulfurtransferase